MFSSVLRLRLRVAEDRREDGASGVRVLTLAALVIDIFAPFRVFSRQPSDLCCSRRGRWSTCTRLRFIGVEVVAEVAAGRQAVSVPVPLARKRVGEFVAQSSGRAASTIGIRTGGRRRRGASCRAAVRPADARRSGGTQPLAEEAAERRAAFVARGRSGHEARSPAGRPRRQRLVCLQRHADVARLTHELQPLGRVRTVDEEDETRLDRVPVLLPDAEHVGERDLFVVRADPRAVGSRWANKVQHIRVEREAIWRQSLYAK